MFVIRIISSQKFSDCVFVELPKCSSFVLSAIYFKLLECFDCMKPNNYYAKQPLSTETTNTPYGSGDQIKVVKKMFTN